MSPPGGCKERACRQSHEGSHAEELDGENRGSAGPGFWPVQLKHSNQCIHLIPTKTFPLRSPHPSRIKPSNKQIPQLRAAAANILLQGQVPPLLFCKYLGVQMQPQGLQMHCSICEPEFCVGTVPSHWELVTVRIRLCSAQLQKGLAALFQQYKFC